MMNEELEVLRNRLVYCQVCTNIKSKERIEELTNIKNPSGISSRWTLTNDIKLKPVNCEDKKGFKHYMLVC